MYNVMIAEDSKPILRNIKGLLEASGLPVRVSATASNGEEAIAAFQLQPIDILLTDIRMPKMDGLTLIDRLKQLQPGLKTVLISGYSDFEYTRKAINLQVDDYLLKPVDKNDFGEVMSRILEKLQRFHEGVSTLFQGLVKDSYWLEMKQKQHFYQSQNVFAVIRRQPFAPGQAEFTAGNVASCLSSPAPFWVIPMSVPDKLLLVADSSWMNEYDTGTAWMADLQQNLMEHGYPVSLAVSVRPMAWHSLAAVCREADGVLEQQLLLAHPIMFDSALPWPATDASSKALDQTTQMLISLLEQRNQDRFVLLLSEQFAHWNTERVKLSDVKRLLGQVAAAFAREWGAGQRQDAGMESSNTAKFGDIDRLFQIPSYESFCAEVLDLVDQGFSLLKSQNKKSGTTLFEQMEQYLRTNLYSHVSISDLAQKFHVSPSYISRIFKRYTGQTFVAYYTAMKIGEACSLMEKRPEMLIKDISDALCFGDQHYFSKVFKERVGQSPVEYKNSVRTYQA